MTIDEEIANQEADAAELARLAGDLAAEVAGLDAIESQMESFMESLK